MKNNDLKKKVEEVLQSTDAIGKAEVGKNFEEAVLVRLVERKSKLGKQVKMTPKRVVWQVAACLTLIVGVNFYIWVGLKTNESTSTHPVVEDYFSELITY